MVGVVLQHNAFHTSIRQFHMCFLFVLIAHTFHNFIEHISVILCSKNNSLHTIKSIKRWMFTVCSRLYLLAGGRGPRGVGTLVYMYKYTHGVF